MHVMLRPDPWPVGVRPHGFDAAERVRRASTGWLAVAVATGVAAVLTAVSAGWLASSRDVGAHSRPHTALVTVGDGESLADLALRTDPEAPVDATVHRIVELNGLRATAVAPGRLLVVPVPSVRELR